jgi:hypothetical protein
VKEKGIRFRAFRSLSSHSFVWFGGGACPLFLAEPMIRFQEGRAAVSSANVAPLCPTHRQAVEKKLSRLALSAHGCCQQKKRVFFKCSLSLKLCSLTRPFVTPKLWQVGRPTLKYRDIGRWHIRLYFTSDRWIEMALYNKWNLKCYALLHCEQTEPYTILHSLPPSVRHALQQYQMKKLQYWLSDTVPCKSIHYPRRISYFVALQPVI